MGAHMHTLWVCSTVRLWGASVSLWSVPVCGVLLFVGCFCLWSASVCRVFLFVECFCLWGASVCGVLLFVECFCLWSASVCGVLCSCLYELCCFAVLPPSLGIVP